MAKSTDVSSAAKDLSEFYARVIRFCWPAQESREPFRQGLARGVLTGMTTLAGLVIPLAVALSVTGVIASVDDAINVALLLAVGATGAFVNISSSALGFSLGSAATANVGLHPTLLTVGIVIAGLVIGRRFAVTNTDTDSQRFHAIGAGVGFATPITVIYLAAHGVNSIGEADSVGLIGPTLLDWVIMVSVFGIPVALGNLAARGSKAVSVWKWASAALSRFVVTYSLLALLAFIAFVVTSSIEPDFGHSVPETNLDLGLEPGALALAIVAVVLFLPTALVSALFLSMGASAALVVSPTNGSITIEQILTALNAGTIALPEFSALGVIGWWSYLVIGVFVILIAGIAGVAAARKLDYTPRKLKDILAVTALYGAFVFVVQHFISISMAWTVAAAPSSQAIADQLTNANGAITFGVTIVTALALAGVVSLSVYFSAGYAGKFIADAFPRAVRRLSSSPATGVRGKSATIFGRTFTVLLVSLFFVPLAIATTERIWGSVDSPVLIGEELVGVIDEADVDALKAYYAAGTVGADEWIDDAIMAKALPSPDHERQIIVFNESGKSWEVGNTDAVVHVKWSIGDGQSLDWAVPTTSTVDRVISAFDHAVYQPALSPARVDFQLSEYLLGADETTVQVNGKDVESGQYALLPGIYKVVAPKYKLLAATDLSLLVAADNQRVVVGDKIELPAGGDEKLNSGIVAAAKRCAKIDAKGASKCFGTSAVIDSAKVVSGTAPKEFFSKKNVRFAPGATTCGEESEDKLKTASSMTRTVQCEQVVTYVKEFHKVRNVRTPIQSCDIDWDAWWNDEYSTDPYDYYYCWTSGYRTSEVEGAVIASVKYSATIPFSVTVTGSLDAKDNFTVQ